MTAAAYRHPEILLCVRCMSAAEVADHPEAKNWGELKTRTASFDLCPRCVRRVLQCVRETPP